MTNDMDLRALPVDLDLHGRTVLLRLDLNLTIKNGAPDLSATSRLTAVVPSLINLVNRGAKVIIAAHLGEPTGVVASLSLQPVVQQLSKILQKQITWLAYDPVTNHDQLIAAVSALKPGELACLENLRFNPGEVSNDHDYAQALASIADLFINDAFSVCHRAHASIVTVPTLLPSYAGPLLVHEVEVLGSLLAQPKRPFVGILAGAKLTTKLPTLKKLLEVCDQVLLAGGMANAVLSAQGLDLGLSKPNTAELGAAKLVVGHKKLVLPIDAVVIGDDHQPHVASLTDVKSGQHVYDVGPATSELFASVLMSAKSVVWNGPLGKFETSPFDAATNQLAVLLNELGKHDCFVVAGGGETLTAIEQISAGAGYAHLSTGGGAMLAFIAGDDLPGLTALSGHNVLP